MFPRRERLHRAEFPAALQGGRRLSSAHLSVVVPHGLRGYAVVISKKTARLSVTRHKIKRQLLAALRTLPPPLPPGLVIFPKTSMRGVSYQDIRDELSGLISKIINL